MSLAFFKFYLAVLFTSLIPFEFFFSFGPIIPFNFYEGPKLSEIS